MSRGIAYTIDETLDFGKYAGKELREVIADDPAYIEWALDEVGHFDLDDEALDYLARSRRAEGRFR